MKKIITIIGGGSSGWLAASMFLKSFGNDYNIVLIADEDIGNIGVGEATIPCIKQVFKFLEIPEKEWLSYCGGTFKYGIKFEGWNEKKDFTHPYYDSIGDETYENFLKYWGFLKSKKIIQENFDEISGILPYMMEEGIYAPEIHDDIAYHFDTGKLGEFLQTWAINKGASYINGNVENSLQDSDGNISEIILKDGRSLHTDFVIDCSGFSSLFLEGIYKEPYISFKEELLCDAAVVRWFDYSDCQEQRVPYTSSIAMKHGWMWKIPLKDRLSVGYVFSKNHCTAEKAQEEMMNIIDAKPINDFRTIFFKTGYHKRSWVKNCLGIGLSYGFIEPLESTGIFLTYTALFQALDTFKFYSSDRGNQVHVGEYNITMEALIHDIKNYVVYHYMLNEKQGAFWENARKVSKGQVSPQIGNIGLTNKKTFSYDIYHKKKFGKEAFFKDLSYYYILTGMREANIEGLDLDISPEKIKKIFYIFTQRKRSLQLKIENKEDYNLFLQKYYTL